MKGEALSWFKWIALNNHLSDWPTFMRQLEIRFGPSTYENHQAELFKLKQVGTISEYQAAFENLSNRVFGLSNEMIMNCFYPV
jgi:hypothetical protein